MTMVSMVSMWDDNGIYLSMTGFTIYDITQRGNI